MSETTYKIRQYHIDGIKGILCFMVMFGHFWNIYRSCQENKLIQNVLFDNITSSFIGSPILVATFWLYAFLVISGYLISYTKITSVKDLFLKSVKRFLRFLIPVFGACLFIYVIQETIGFYADDTKCFFQNKWFQKYYVKNLSFISVFTESINALLVGKCQFNNPFWVIKDMFISSILIYFCNYMENIKKYKSYYFLILFFSITVYFKHPVISACLLGYVVGKLNTLGNCKITNNTVEFIVIYAAVLIFFLSAIKQKILPDIFNKTSLYTLFWGGALILINKTQFIINLFSKPIFLLIGKISFGVYAFHWPVICSVGSLVLIHGIQNEYGVIFTFVVSLVISVIFTIILSIIYHLIVERITEIIVRNF